MHSYVEKKDHSSEKKILIIEGKHELGTSSKLMMPTDGTAMFFFSYYYFRLGDLLHYEQDSKVQFVIDGVYAFAYALDKLKSDVCPGYTGGVCPAMAHYDGGQFYKNYLLKVDFQGKIG